MLNFPSHLAARAAFISALVLACLLGTTASALAVSAPIHIAGTGGEGVFIRPEPNTSRPAIGWMPEGASPDYNCFAWGQNIGGVPIWFNVNYGGVTGFYASYYDDSSYHSNEELTAKYGVPLCGSAPSAPPPAPSSPVGGAGGSGNLIYSVFNTEGGVYFRNSPNWEDTSRIAGVGVYDGDQVQEICGAMGGAVGPYANHWWSYVKNLTRPGAGEGWVNAHFINDGAPADSPSPGEPGCGAGTPGANGAGAGKPAGPTGSAAPGESMFFSPNENYSGTRNPIRVANYELRESEWASSTRCDPSVAVKAVERKPKVETLAGWSLGRLGPMYALTSSTLRSRIHLIVLFDPGHTSNFKGSCDPEINVNALLAAWLGRDAHNRMLLLTGEDSEEPSGGSNSRYTYSGLWHYYFAGTWNQRWASQLQVCDYHGLEHEAVLHDFAWVVENPPPSGCPTVVWDGPPTAWNP